jgi:hypothetical protein
MAGADRSLSSLRFLRDLHTSVGLWDQGYAKLVPDPSRDARDRTDPGRSVICSVQQALPIENFRWHRAHP